MEKQETKGKQSSPFANHLAYYQELLNQQKHFRLCISSTSKVFGQSSQAWSAHIRIRTESVPSSKRTPRTAAKWMYQTSREQQKLRNDGIHLHFRSIKNIGCSPKTILPAQPLHKEQNLWHLAIHSQLVNRSTLQKIRNINTKALRNYYKSVLWKNVKDVRDGAVEIGLHESSRSTRVISVQSR